MTWRGQTLGLAGGCRREHYWCVCLCVWLWHGGGECVCALLREPVHILRAVHTAVFALKHICKYDKVQQTIYMNLCIMDS